MRSSTVRSIEESTISSASGESGIQRENNDEVEIEPSEIVITVPIARLNIMVSKVETLLNSYFRKQNLKVVEVNSLINFLNPSCTVV